MQNNEYRKLDFAKVMSKPSTTVTMQKALKDITPIKWSAGVISGKEKVTIK